nr:peptidylprolyl isomerase [Desulfobulbaceae bacterium]
MPLIPILLSFAFCLFHPISGNAEIVDRIVATVDQNIITLSELNEEGHAYFQAIMQNVPTQQLESEMQKARKEVLDQLIERLLIQQQADKFDMKISEEDIDITIDSILMENNISIADFRHDLQTRGTSEDVYRQKVRSNMLRSRLINFLIRSKIVISEEKIQNYYNKYYANKLSASGYHILQMGFLWGDKYKVKTQEEARQNAEYARKKLLEGEDFATLAKNLSDLPSAEDGGDIGTFEEKELAAYMRDTILAMQPGETTPIIQTPVGFQILKLLSSNKDNSQPLPFNEVHDEIKTLLFRQEMEKSYDQWISDIRASSYIKHNL